MPIVAAVLDVLLASISTFCGVLNSLFECLFLTFKMECSPVEVAMCRKETKNKKASQPLSSFDRCDKIGNDKYILYIVLKISLW